MLNAGIISSVAIKCEKLKQPLSQAEKKTCLGHCRVSMLSFCCGGGGFFFFCCSFSQVFFFVFFFKCTLRIVLCFLVLVSDLSHVAGELGSLTKVCRTNYVYSN